MDIMDIRDNSFAPYGEHPDRGTESATRDNLCQALLTHDTDRVRELLKTGGAIKKNTAFYLEYRSNVFPEGDATEESSRMKRRLDAGAEILRLLHGAGFTVPMQTPCGGELTYTVCRSCSRILHGHDPDLIPNDDFTALRYAVSPLALKAVLDSGVDVNAKDENGDTVLTVIINSSDGYFHADEMVDILLEAGAEFELSRIPRVWRQAWPALNVFNDVAQVKVFLTLLKRGRVNHWDVELSRYADRPDFYLRRALWRAIEAIYAPQPDSCFLPLEDTDLFIAASYGEVKDVVDSLARGANVNACAQDGHTPLMFAAAFNSADVVKALLENGADINARNFQYHTALIVAALRRQRDPDPSVIGVLAKADADQAKQEAARTLFTRSDE